MEPYFENGSTGSTHIRSYIHFSNQSRLVKNKIKQNKDINKCILLFCKTSCFCCNMLSKSTSVIIFLIFVCRWFTMEIISSKNTHFHFYHQFEKLLEFHFFGLRAWWTFWKNSRDSHVLRDQKWIFLKPVSILSIPWCLLSNPIWITQFGFETKKLEPKH